MRRTLISILGCLVCICLLVACEKQSADGSGITEKETGSVSKPAAEERESASSFLSDRFTDPVKEWGRYDQLIDSLYHEQSPSDHLNITVQAEQMLLNTGCIIPLYEMQTSYLAKELIADLYQDPYSIDHYADIVLNREEAIIRIGISRVPVLDPAYALIPDDLSLIGNCFSGLYAFDRTGAVIPACADHYEVNEDGSLYTFYLKEGLKWAGGADLTPSDFVYSWKRTAAANKRYGHLFSFISGYPDHLAVEAVSDNAFTVSVSHPCDHLEALLAFPVFAPVRKDMIDANPDKWYQSGGSVFNGPYTCMYSEPVKSIALIPNSDWIPMEADGAARINIEFDIFDSDVSAFEAYKAGKLDMVKSVPVSVLLDYAGINSAEYRTSPLPGSTFLAFNTRSPLFSRMTPEESVCFRLAVSELIDRAYILSETAPEGRMIANSLIPWDQSDGMGEDDYSVGSENDDTGSLGTEAVDAGYLLTLAGFSLDEHGAIVADQAPTLQCLYPESSVCRETIEAVAQDLAVAGIRLISVSAEPASFHRKARSGAYDIVLDQRISVYGAPVSFLEEWTSDSPVNYCLFGK